MGTHPTYFVKHPDESFSVANPQPIPAAKINEMVDRFLGWKLPADFAPDAGISFKAEYNEGTPRPGKHEPIGTNLLSADQARAMIEYMLAETPTFEGDRNAKSK